MQFRFFKQTNKQQRPSKFQFEEQDPETSQLKRNHGALAIDPISGQKERTAYQETAPGASNQLLGTRDRVFAILSPVARSVAVQEVDFIKNFNV